MSYIVMTDNQRWGRGASIEKALINALFQGGWAPTKMHVVNFRGEATVDGFGRVHADEIISDKGPFEIPNDLFKAFIELEQMAYDLAFEIEYLEEDIEVF